MKRPPRIPIVNSPIDPRRTNIFIDSCAFDPKYSPEQEASEKLFEMSEQGSIILVIPESVMQEINNPNVPKYVKDEALNQIYTKKQHLSVDENISKEKLLKIISGNGEKEKMQKDAEHLFRAKRDNAVYFLTTDKGILRKKKK